MFHYIALTEAYACSQINGALPLAYPHNVNRVSDYTCIVFIFIYSLGYSMGFGPASWVYGAEV
jgi:hypothetical protein